MITIKQYSLVLERATGIVLQFLEVDKDNNAVLLHLRARNVVYLMEPMNMLEYRLKKGYIQIFEPREDNVNTELADEWENCEYAYRDALNGENL